MDFCGAAAWVNFTGVPSRKSDNITTGRIYQDIQNELRSQYVLGFTPDAAGAPGRARKISVKVSGHGKVVVRHRVGYRLQQ